jgi:hypothetical protein
LGLGTAVGGWVHQAPGLYVFGSVFSVALGLVVHATVLETRLEIEVVEVTVVLQVGEIVPDDGRLLVFELTLRHLGADEVPHTVIGLQTGLGRVGATNVFRLTGSAANRLFCRGYVDPFSISIYENILLRMRLIGCKILML